MKALAMKEVLWQCFDIEKVYDMMYREGVINAAENWNCRKIL